MTLADILPGARQLTPAEKLKLIRILIEYLDDNAENPEDTESGFSAERLAVCDSNRFQESWQQAITGQTLPLDSPKGTLRERLWEDRELVKHPRSKLD
jgi:hypothetical protein